MKLKKIGVMCGQSLEISLKSDINIVTENVFCKMFENQLAIEYGEKPLYISHKLMCMYYDLGKKRNQK